MGDLANMRYEGLEWQINPLTLTVVQEQDLQAQRTNSGYSQTFATNRKMSVYKGEGEFVGEDCTDRFRSLEEHFMKHKKGVLTLPFGVPFEAYFTRLSILCDDTPNIVKYSFEFRRDLSASPYFGKKEFHLVKEGESLYDVAYLEGIAVDKLIELNPRIREIMKLKAGEQVRLC